MKDELVGVQKALYEQNVRGNTVSRENLHLTLAFIGEYPEAERVMEVLAELSFRPFEIALEGLGCFGNHLWAGVAESAALAAVVRRLRRALAQNGIPFDRKSFAPHITLIRKASGELREIRVPASSMTVGRISLMRSDRGKKGMIYTEIAAKEAAED